MENKPEQEEMLPTAAATQEIPGDENLDTDIETTSFEEEEDEADMEEGEEPDDETEEQEEA